MNAFVKNKKISRSDLRYFTGTTTYHYHSHPFGFGIYLTDGCHFLREKAECYWLFSDIAIHLFHSQKLQHYRENNIGLIWRLKIRNEEKVRLTCEYDQGCLLASCTYSYSDIGKYLDDITELVIRTFPQIRADKPVQWIAFLPSED